MYVIKMMVMFVLSILGPYELVRTLIAGSFQIPTFSGFSGSLLIASNVWIYVAYATALMFFSGIFIALIVAAIMDVIENKTGRKIREEKDRRFKRV